MTATFDMWELAARSALAERGIGYNEATPLIEDARAHSHDSGQDPWQALGSPAEFAADVAAGRPAAQAQLDRQGKRARDYFSDALFIVAFISIGATLVAAWVARSWYIPITTAGAGGFCLVFAAVFAGYALPNALRASGHPRLAPWGFVLSAASVVGAGTVFTQLPRTRIGEIPAWGALAVSLFLCWLLTRPDRAPEEPDAAADDPAAVDDPADPQVWFRRLHDLLIGRFDVPADRAAAMVNDARAHVAAAGSTPHVEFPSLVRYAHDLADVEPARRGPWWRGARADALRSLVFLVLVLVVVVDAFLAGPTWLAICGLVVLVWLAWDLTPRIRRLRRHDGARPNGRQL